ncbi:MAG: M23 family metallopeptidase [Campylobacteraceae bacterium]|nr:M23 family metallopeptidase [Campylobacteraceae bacterium]
MQKIKNGIRNGSSGIVISIILIVFIAALGFLYSSSMFERNAPKIGIANVINWNLKKPLELKLSDDSGIKFVRITLSDGKNSVLLLKKIYTKIAKNQNIKIIFPRTGFVSTKKIFKLNIEATDSSKWNFLSGNSATKVVKIKIDRKRPELFVVNNSYKIIKGGVAVVVFKAKDENLKDLYIDTNFGKRYYPTPFYKRGFYISLLAWPVEQKKFRAFIVATDDAGNISRVPVRLYLKEKKYRISKIELKDNFLNGKINDLVEQNNPDLSSASKVEKFKYVNEVLRKKNEDLIEKMTTKTDKSMVNGFFQNKFYPLKNGAAVASFGDHRFYVYKGKQVSSAYHLGLDLASIAGAKIRTQNRGKIVYADLNGIYGNNLIMYHGLGLYTLYGHASSFLVNVDDSVKKGQAIANTGQTGLALGDHLHFGVLVQGVEVRPEEWMDNSWLKTNIYDIIKSSKKMIDRK